MMLTYDSDGIIVAKDYAQVHGIYYDETFGLAMKLKSAHIQLTLFVAMG